MSPSRMPASVFGVHSFPFQWLCRNMQDRAPKVFDLQADGFFDAKAGAREQNIERPQVSFGLGDDATRLLGRKRRAALLPNLRHVHKVVVPLYRVDRLTFVIQRRPHHHLNQLQIIGNGLRRKTRFQVAVRGCPSSAARQHRRRSVTGLSFTKSLASPLAPGMGRGIERAAFEVELLSRTWW